MLLLLVLLNKYCLTKQLLVLLNGWSGHRWGALWCRVRKQNIQIWLIKDGVLQNTQPWRGCNRLLLTPYQSPHCPGFLLRDYTPPPVLTPAFPLIIFLQSLSAVGRTYPKQSWGENCLEHTFCCASIAFLLTVPNFNDMQETYCHSQNCKVGVQMLSNKHKVRCLCISVTAVLCELVCESHTSICGRLTLRGDSRQNKRVFYGISLRHPWQWHLLCTIPVTSSLALFPSLSLLFSSISPSLTLSHCH